MSALIAGGRVFRSRPSRRRPRASARSIPRRAPSCGGRISPAAPTPGSPTTKAGSTSCTGPASTPSTPPPARSCGGSRATPPPLDSSPTAVDGDLYLSHLNGTTRYRGDTGQVVWSAGGGVIFSDRAPTVDGDRVYAGNVCTPISRATGQPVAGWESVLTADDHAAVPFHRGHLFADLSRGRGVAFAFDVTRGITTAGIGASFPPAVIGNVAVTSDVYNVTAREFRPGRRAGKWTRPATQDIVMPPLIVGRTVYVVLDQPRPARARPRHGPGRLRAEPRAGVPRSATRRAAPRRWPSARGCCSSRPRAA